MSTVQPKEKPKKIPMSPSFIVERELKITPKQRKMINTLLEDARLIQNTVLGMGLKRYRKMVQTKVYRSLYQELRSVNEHIQTQSKNSFFKEQRKEIITSLQQLNQEFRLTKAEFEKDAKIVRGYYHHRLDSVAMQKAATRAWISFEKYLNKKSNRCHFLKRGENTSLEGKSNEASVVIEYNEGQFQVRYGKERFSLQPIQKNDLYMQETMSFIRSFFETPLSENKAVQHNIKLGTDYLHEKITKEQYYQQFQSTYRVKYNRLVKKLIRGRERFYVQMVVEGVPVPKRHRDGSFRHELGKGKVGNDFGTQTVGVASDKKVALMNLAEAIEKPDAQLKKLQRKMDRSRRQSNPVNYKTDGTIKKGKKTWMYSNRYQQLKAKVKELHRKNATKRKLAHQTLINQLISLGDVFYGENMSFKGLQKRKKETTVNEQGKFVRKKRFGKTLANKAPGLFVSLYQKKVEQLGGRFFLVNTTKFKASQYDHTTRKAIKKQLSERWHVLSDGTKVQRDLYSSFLLKCSNGTLDAPDFEQCEKEFSSFKEKHEEFIQHVKKAKHRIKNSGINVS